MRLAALLSGLLLLAPIPACAGRLLDYIRNYDLNDYALGVSISTSQSPYLGTTHSKWAYPFLTSFRHSAFTDDWLLLQGENIGFRYVTKNDWEFGLLGRTQLLGLDFSENDDLLGLDEREWAIEAGPVVGWRGLPVHIQFRSYWELPNRHDGTTSEFEFSLPWEYRRGYVVPAVTFTHLSHDYSNYYFGVSADEASAAHPEYQPGSAINTEVGISLGFELGSHWLLQTRLGVEFLDSAVRNSSLVDRGRLWSGSISLAYNPDLFQPRDYLGVDKDQKVEVRVGAFHSRTSTKLLLNATDTEPADDVDLEEILGVADTETVAQLDALYRIAYYHRFELGYFQLRRNASTIAQRAIRFGDQLYSEGSKIETRTESELLRLGYSYSLMRDGQKELGLTAGLAYTRFEAHVRVDDQQQAERVSVETLLPALGVYGSVPLGAKWSVGADVDLFFLDLPRYDGYMAYLALDLERKFSENFGVGLGYNFYGMRLKSKNENLDGTIRVRYQGPKLYLSMKF
jgi:outer membrane protein